ncbi:MAG: hypothetical protein HZA10_01590 [Nitrospirae bacterium]|nr:hypothetical protein [Nitrospirota bacterium]
MQDARYRIIKTPIRILSSKAFLLWVIGCWIFYYVLSAIWLKEAFGSFISGVRVNLFIQAPFLLFLVSGYLNLIRAAKSVFNKGMVQFLLWVLLPAGALLFFTGFFLSICTRQTGQIIIGQGDVIKPPWSSKSFRVTGIKPGLREKFLDIDMERGIFAYEPKLIIIDELSSKESGIGVFPPSKINGTYYHILNFGLAPGIRFSEGGDIKAEGYMPLKILTPGSGDYFKIPQYPYRFLVSMKPEKTFQRGNVYASQFNLKNFSFKIKVFKGEKVIEEGESSEGIIFDNFTLQFFEPAYWAQLEAVKDSARLIILYGILLVFAGIPAWLVRFLLRLKQSAV